MKRIYLTSALVLIGLAGTACSHRDSRQDNSNAGDAAARQLGRVAHSVAKDAGKFAEKAGRGLARAAQDAHEGWKQAAQEDHAKRARKPGE